MTDEPELNEEEFDEAEATEADGFVDEQDVSSEEIAEEKADPAPEKELILDDPYEWDNCQATITIGLFPDDKHLSGRQVIIGGYTHQDTPILHFFRLAELQGNLEFAIDRIIDELKESLPGRAAERQEVLNSREKDRQEREKKRKEYEAKRATSTPVHVSRPEKPTFKPELLEDPDALMELNLSVVALKMLRDLDQYGARDWKMFRKTYRDQPVLDLLTLGYLQKAGEDKIEMTEKGKSAYQRAVAWRPSTESKKKAVEAAKQPDIKQGSLF